MTRRRSSSVVAALTCALYLAGCLGDDDAAPKPGDGSDDDVSADESRASGDDDDRDNDGDDRSGNQAGDDATATATTADGRPIVEPPPINVAANDPMPRAPMDATPSPDGSEVYYTALTTQDDGSEIGAVFHVPADGGTPELLARGGLLVAPVGIAISLDGKKLFVADSAGGGDTQGLGGAILELSVSGGEPSVVGGSEGYAPSGLVVHEDGVFFSGRDPETGEAGVFRIGDNGGAVQALAQGSPLRDPGGLAIDEEGIAYVADALGAGNDARVFRIEDGEVTSFVENIGVGFPAGVTLTLDESTLIVSGLDRRSRRDVVYFVSIGSGDVSVMTEPVSAFGESAGLHRAHEADVFAWADSEANGSGTVYVLKP